MKGRIVHILATGPITPEMREQVERVASELDRQQESVRGIRDEYGAEAACEWTEKPLKPSADG